MVTIPLFFHLMQETDICDISTCMVRAVY